MKHGFRQSMAWLHTWTGLVLGWLLFAIFLTGTIAYFRAEATYWMRPELHRTIPEEEVTTLALRRLHELAPEAGSWSITLPSERSPVLQVGWSAPDQPQSPRRGGHSAFLDPTTGERLFPRETAGGEFLYRFHFELFGMPRDLARWIVGIATMFMFIAIISGVITHKKIFKDFFTFRPGKGQRSWLDMHNMTAVLALPYHLMITFSGLVLFMTTLMPLAFDTSATRTPPAGVLRQIQDVTPPAASVRSDMAPVQPLMLLAQQVWGMPVGRIVYEKRQEHSSEILLVPERNTRLTAHSGSGSNGVERMRFDAQSGELIESVGAPHVHAVSATHNVLGSLHRARFADIGLRWLFFVAGLAGTVMIGTGMVLWVSKRAAKHGPGKQSTGLRLVQRLNIGAISGLGLATAGYFWANRLIPSQIPNREGLEVAAFFMIWLAAFLYPFLRCPARAWPEQLYGTAILALTLPVLNAATGQMDLIAAIRQGNNVLVGFECMALICGIICAYAGWRATPGRAAVSARNPRRQIIAGE